MHIISAREFRTNQSKFLSAAKNGQSVVLTSRLGSFKITPVDEDDNLTTRICDGLKQVKMIKEGKAKAYTIDELLDEL